MSTGGVRELTVLTEFKPFGLTAETLDGGKPSSDDYHYFVFDPQVARQRDEADELDEVSPLSGEGSDHEIFVRGNRITWSTGCRVYKRFTLPSKVIKVCWCQMGDKSEALLCVLHVDSLTIYGITGEVVSVPLPHAITSIWPLPFGLLLQRAHEGSLLTNISLSSSNPYLSARDRFRQKRDVGYSGQHNYTPPHVLDFSTRNDETSLSSHLILKYPLEDPQVIYVEERGKLNLMWEFDEKMIWSSDCVPLMVSYNKGKMQHSLWAVDVNNSNIEMMKSMSSVLFTPGMLTKYLFRRIWQGKGQTPACKIFLATDDDFTPMLCFLLQEQKKLLSLRLQSLEIFNETVYDIKPDMSWSVSAIAAAAITVTRPKAKVGQLPVRDIIALTPENTLLLYSGKLCLCKYIMPSPLGKEQVLSRTKLSGTTNTSPDPKIVDLADAVEGRVNLVLNNGQIYRCTLRRSPSSSLTNDCITAIAEGLSSSMYNHFRTLLWADDDSTYLAKANSSAESEWGSFCHVIRRMCQKPNTTPSVSYTSWEFLIQSKYHQQYMKSNYVAGAFSGLSSELQGLDSSAVVVAQTQNAEETFYFKLLTETLDSLHAVYETLKLDNLRKRCNFFTLSLFILKELYVSCQKEKHT